MKYELTEESIDYHGRTLYRIKALKDFGLVKKGDFGGWIESTDNLSQHDDCWVSKEAKVFGGGRVTENAFITDEACIFGKAWISGQVWVGEQCMIYDYAFVSGNIQLNTYKLRNPSAFVFTNEEQIKLWKKKEDEFLEEVKKLKVK